MVVWIQDLWPTQTTLSSQHHKWPCRSLTLSQSVSLIPLSFRYIMSLTIIRVLLQTKGTLRKGNGLLHQPNSQQDSSHVPTNGHRAKRNRSSCPHRRWFS